MKPNTETFSVATSYKTILPTITTPKHDTYIGYYSDVFIDHPHTNLYTHIEPLGPILISYLQNEQTCQFLVRSILGFKKFGFSGDQFKGEYWLNALKACIDQYFMCVFEKWSIEYVQHVEEVESYGIFGMFSSRVSKEDSMKSDTDTVSTMGSTTSSVRTVDLIKSRVYNQKLKFATNEIIKGLKEIDSTNFNELVEIENFNIDDGYVVDVIVDKGVSNELLSMYFGVEIGKNIVNNNTGESLSVQQKDIDNYVIEFKKGMVYKVGTIKELITTERGYFEKMAEFKSKIDEDIKSKIDATGVTAFNRIFVDFNAILDLLEKKQAEIKKLLSTFEIEFVKMDKIKDLNDAEMDNLIFGLFEIFDFGQADIKIYRKYCLDNEKIIENLSKSENVKLFRLSKITDSYKRSLSDYLNTPMQRFCRYPLLLKALARALNPNCKNLSVIKKTVLKWSNHIKELNTFKDTIISIQSMMILSKVISNCNFRIYSNTRCFYTQLDCVSKRKDENITIVLLSDLILILKRKGDPISIVKLTGSENMYEFIKKIPLNAISFKKGKNSHFRVRLEEEESREFVKIKNSSTKIEDGKIIEFVNLEATSPFEKNYFLKMFRTAQNNDSFINSKSRLFCTEKSSKIFYHVYEKSDYKLESCAEAVIDCTDDQVIGNNMEEEALVVYFSLINLERKVKKIEEVKIGGRNNEKEPSSNYDNINSGDGSIINDRSVHGESGFEIHTEISRETEKPNKKTKDDRKNKSAENKSSLKMILNDVKPHFKDEGTFIARSNKNFVMKRFIEDELEALKVSGNSKSGRMYNDMVNVIELHRRCAVVGPDKLRDFRHEMEQFVKEIKFNRTKISSVIKDVDKIAFNILPFARFDFLLLTVENILDFLFKTGKLIKKNRIKFGEKANQSYEYSSMAFVMPIKSYFLDNVEITASEYSNFVFFEDIYIPLENSSIVYNKIVMQKILEKKIASMDILELTSVLTHIFKNMVFFFMSQEAVLEMKTCFEEDIAVNLKTIVFEPTWIYFKRYIRHLNSIAKLGHFELLNQIFLFFEFEDPIKLLDFLNDSCQDK